MIFALLFILLVPKVTSLSKRVAKLLCAQVLRTVALLLTLAKAYYCGVGAPALPLPSEEGTA